jgi:hypothetical protein
VTLDERAQSSSDMLAQILENRRASDVLVEEVRQGSLKGLYRFVDEGEKLNGKGSGLWGVRGLNGFKQDFDDGGDGVVDKGVMAFEVAQVCGRVAQSFAQFHARENVFC